MFHRKPIADNRRLLVVLLCALLSIVAAPSPSAAQTAAPTALPTSASTAATVPLFKQIGQIGKGAVESIGWIANSNQVEIHVGAQVQYFDAHLRPLGTLDLKDKAITAIAHNDTYTTLGFEDGTVQLYTIADRTLYATLTGHTSRINTIAFSADGTKLISGSNDTMARIWSIATHSLLQTLTPSTFPVIEVNFALSSFDNISRVFTLSNALKMSVWNAETGQLITTAEPSALQRIANYDAALHYLFTNVVSGGKERLILTDSVTGVGTLVTTGFSQVADTALFSPDSRTLLINGNASGKAIVLDTATRHIIKTITFPVGKLRYTDFTEDSTQLAIGTTDGLLILENLTTGQESRFQASTTSIQRLQFNHAGDRLFIDDTSGQIAVWDTTGKRVGSLDNGADVVYFDYEAKSPVIVTTNSTGEAIAWDATTLAKLGTASSFSTPILNMAWSPDGKQLAGTRADQVIIIWDATTDQEIRQLKGHTLAINAIAWSPDGKLIASASSDMTMRIWDAATGQELHKITFTDRLYSIAFSPDSQQIAVGARQSNKYLSLFTRAGKPLFTVPNLVQTVTQVAWRPNDPAHLLAADFNGKLLLVDLTDLNGTFNILVQQLQNAKTPVTNFVWSPDGSQVMVSSTDRILRVWAFDNGLALKHTVFTRVLTSDLSWNKTGDLIASTSGSLIRLIDPTGAEVTTLAGHTDAVYNTQWSPDGIQLASSSGDGTIRIWQRQ